MNTFTASLTHDPKPGDGYMGQKFVTIKGKRLRMCNVIHCCVREHSDIRVWVPVNLPWEKPLYLYRTVYFRDLTKKQQDKFFNLKARRSIWPRIKE